MLAGSIGCPGNAAADVEKFSQRSTGDIEVFSPEEVWALVRAGLRSLRFHDLRHTFGTRVIAKADTRRV